MTKYQLKILKMHCSSCAANIESYLQNSKGIESANLNYANEKLTVRFDDKVISLEEIKKIIVQLGYDSADFDSVKIDNSKIFLWRFWGSLILGLPAVYLAMGKMVGLPVPQNIMDFSSWIQMASATVVILVNIGIWWSGVRSLVKLRPNMDSLIFVGTASAYFYSLIRQLRFGESMILYYESAVFILIFIALGKYLEAKSKSRASSAIEKLIGLQPSEAVILDANGQEMIKNISEIAVGDIVLAKPGGKIAVDGEVIEGYSSIDEKMLTGESIPIEKTIGETVYAGTINQTGRLVYKATKIGKDTMLSQIVSTVDDALSSKAPIQLLADRVALYFVPAVILIAIATLAAWLLLGNSDLAISNFVSVLIIACPCALGLATPTAVLMGTGNAASQGILIKELRALEAADKLKYVIFDKTGTLTVGEPQVTAVTAVRMSEKILLSIAASLEKDSEHPLAKAIINYAEKYQTAKLHTENFQATPGQGISASIKGKEYLLGNLLMLQKEQIALNDELNEKSKKLEQQGNTIVYVAEGKRLVGIIAIADQIKAEAERVIKKLKRSNIQPVLLSGDNHRVAEAVGSKLEIDKNYIFAEVLPEQKALVVKALQNNLEDKLKLRDWDFIRHSASADGGKVVAMVGDGINDSPALAQSDLGIALGSGSDIAMETGDIILVKNKLDDVLNAIDISRLTLRKIRQNLFWAFVYNIIGIPIAAGVLYSPFGLTLNPAIAALAMALSSLSVVSNSLLMKKYFR